MGGRGDRREGMLGNGVRRVLGAGRLGCKGWAVAQPTDGPRGRTGGGSGQAAGTPADSFLLSSKQCHFRCRPTHPLADDVGLAPAARRLEPKLVPQLHVLLEYGVQRQLDGLPRRRVCLVLLVQEVPGILHLLKRGIRLQAQQPGSGREGTAGSRGRGRGFPLPRAMGRRRQRTAPRGGPAVMGRWDGPMTV